MIIQVSVLIEKIVVNSDWLLPIANDHQSSKWVAYRSLTTNLAIVTIGTLEQSIIQNVFSRQVQVNAGLLEGWSEWTTLILRNDNHSWTNDDSWYPILWFYTVRWEPGMLQWSMPQHQRNSRHSLVMTPKWVELTCHFVNERLLCRLLSLELIRNKWQFLSLPSNFQLNLPKLLTLWRLFRCVDCSEDQVNDNRFFTLLLHRFSQA